MIWKYFFGILAVLFGIYQMVNSYKYVKAVQKHGNKSTSYFVGYAVWYSFLFGLFFFIMGIYLIVSKGAF